jgi:hypothetical protein
MNRTTLIKLNSPKWVRGQATTSKWLLKRTLKGYCTLCLLFLLVGQEEKKEKENGKIEKKKQKKEKQTVGEQKKVLMTIYRDGKENSNIFDGTASKERIEQVLSEIHQSSAGNQDSHQKESDLATMVILQKGGTSRRMSGSKQFKCGHTTVTLSTIREVCKCHKITVRQLARSIRDEIIHTVLSIDDPDLEGNLAKKFCRACPNATQEEKYWASDFQTDNTECPERVREWLTRDHTSRFDKN